MKRMMVMLTVLLVILVVFECEQKKPNNPNLEDPGYYYPLNSNYKWTYVLLGPGPECVASDDSFALTAIRSHTRHEGSGWDILSSIGDTGFVYRIGDTIFFEYKVTDGKPSYKVLVGPIKDGTSWTDAWDFDYYIMGFEDVNSSAAGVTYRRCAKIRRTRSDDPNPNYFWWAPQYGKVKHAQENSSGDCLSGEELKRLDKPHVNP